MTKSKKRFSLRNKLLLVFGLLTFVVGFILALIGVRTARKAVTEKVATHLIDKATDTAEIIDGRVNTMFQFLEGIARMPQIRDASVSSQNKTEILIKEAQFNPLLEELYFADVSGIQYYPDGRQENYANIFWFKEAAEGKRITTEPYNSTYSEGFFITFSIPVYDDNRNIIGVLGADVDGLLLSNLIDDIVVGKTGECYILGLTGTTIAQKNFELVRSQDNILNNAKTNSDFTSLATFTQHALEIDESEVGYYEYNGIRKIASYATMKTTGWTVIVQAPKEEFMGTVNELRLEMILIGFGVLAVSLIIVFFGCPCNDKAYQCCRKCP